MHPASNHSLLGSWESLIPFPAMPPLLTIKVGGSIKKNKIMPFAANMDATGNDYIKWSKSERQRQIPQDITYMWNRKYDWTNEPIYEIEPRTRRTDWWLPRGRGAGKGCSGRLGLADVNFYICINIYIFIEQINNKVLLYSTENDIQYSVINHNGKEHLKRIYVEV